MSNKIETSISFHYTIEISRHKNFHKPHKHDKANRSTQKFHLPANYKQKQNVGLTKLIHRNGL
jgi:hypothetical protein